MYVCIKISVELACMMGTTGIKSYKSDKKVLRRVPFKHISTLSETEDIDPEKEKEKKYINRKEQYPKRYCRDFRQNIYIYIYILYCEQHS